ncbi:MAG: GIY-YIG nuclease family protein [Bacteroidota bacterium]
MVYTVYVIQSEINNRLYKGMTQNIIARLNEHNSGRNFSTSPYRPWKLVYTKQFSDAVAARNWEKYLKSGSGREMLNKLLIQE